MSGSSHKCEFLIPNPDFIDIGSQDLDASSNNLNPDNCKFFKCIKYGTQLNSYGDQKYYCCNHTKLVIKIYKKDIANKAKEEYKQEQLKKKEEIKIV